MSSPQRVVIIGGGLAGMTVAKEVRKHGLEVLILEASDRLGGKAGSDPHPQTGEPVEHGYHVFPGWYANTRALLAELGIENDLIDIPKFYHLRRGEFPKYYTFYPVSSLPNMFRNVFSGLIPWTESALSFYFLIDLAAESFRQRGFLDRVSANGFLRSRFYRTEGIANLHQQTVLQSSAIPNYQISAMTTQKLGMCWIQKQDPIFSILNGDLQEVFIRPFEQQLRSLGVDIEFGRSVKRLILAKGRVVGLEFESGPDLERPEDLFVLATPMEVTRQFVDKDVHAAEAMALPGSQGHKRLSDLWHLHAAPMAALHLFFRRRIRDIPAEHVTLFDSRYGLSFVDVSRHWGIPADKTVLSVISSDFESLRNLSHREMATQIVSELAEFLQMKMDEIVPELENWNDIENYMRPNIDVPLFLNTVGAWRFRPGTRTRLESLYIAGDYCRSEADLTTMESAVGSALATARDLLKDAGLDTQVGPISLDLPSRAKLLLMKWSLFPMVAPLGLYYWLRALVRRHTS